MLISQKHAEMRRKRCRKTPDPLRLFRFVCPCACSVIVLCCWVFSCRGWRPPLAPPPTHRPHRLLFVALVPRKARKDRERERERERQTTLKQPLPSFTLTLVLAFALHRHLSGCSHKCHLSPLPGKSFRNQQALKKQPFTILKLQQKHALGDPSRQSEQHDLHESCPGLCCFGCFGSLGPVQWRTEILE